MQSSRNSPILIKNKSCLLYKFFPVKQDEKPGIRDKTIGMGIIINIFCIVFYFEDKLSTSNYDN